MFTLVKITPGRGTAFQFGFGQGRCRHRNSAGGAVAQPEATILKPARSSAFDTAPGSPRRGTRGPARSRDDPGQLAQGPAQAVRTSAAVRSSAITGGASCVDTLRSYTSGGISVTELTYPRWYTQVRRRHRFHNRQRAPISSVTLISMTTPTMAHRLTAEFIEAVLAGSRRWWPCSPRTRLATTRSVSAISASVSLAFGLTVLTGVRVRHHLGRPLQPGRHIWRAIAKRVEWRHCRRTGRRR